MQSDNFLEILKTRKTVRNYEDYIPDVSDIEKIIDSARLAPSACNNQNWEFIAVYNKEVKDKMAQEILKLYDIVLSKIEDEKTKRMIEGFKQHSTFFTSAPVVIACVMTKHPAFFEGILESTGFPADEITLMRPDSQLLSMGGAIENMALAAHAMGLASCWMVAPVMAQKGLKEILNIKKEDWLVSLLTIGKPVSNTGRAPKKNLDEVMRIIKLLF